MTEIVSRETIARLADNAAARWVANPSSTKPTNPFDAHGQPEHFREWRASFERSLLLHSSDELEGSA